ncbi:hypothetical protein [Thalassobaculum sp.]|uniref:hypothetical protein n=1 Tax=Thalassobaculum sp. TaxID=2022740 RepID=UPI0032EEAF2D
MNLRDLLETIAGSAVEDWTILFRPTFRHRIVEIAGAEGSRDRLDSDEHLVAFSYKPDLALSMAYGMVEQGSYVLPDGHPFAQENARTRYLDIFIEGRLSFREIVVSVDRNRCLLPMPRDWNAPVSIPTTQYSLVRLIHALAGPPTDYDAYFEQAGMQRVDASWP